MQCVRHRYPALSSPAKNTMQLFMWQRDIVGVAHHITECSDVLVALDDAPDDASTSSSSALAAGYCILLFYPGPLGQQGYGSLVLWWCSLSARCMRTLLRDRMGTHSLPIVGRRSGIPPPTAFAGGAICTLFAH